MSDQSPPRVLLIDDEDMAYEMTRAIMDQIPRPAFVLERVSTAAEGEAAMARGEHDVYLVDYLIGTDSGIDLVRRARQERNRAPMILLTDKGRWEIDVQAMEAGVSDYLDKAKVDPDLMERSIRYALDRARAEAALRDSEARHRSLFDHLPVGLFRTGVDGSLVDANPALVSMLGHPDRSTLESRFARNFFVNPAHRQNLLDRLDRVGVLQGFESDLERLDGGVVHVRVAARSHRGDRGETVYIEGAVEDVSEERAARDLQGRAARFTWVFEHSGMALLIADLQGTIMDANAVFLTASGYDRDDVRGRSLSDLAPPEDRAMLAEEFQRVASGGDGVAPRRLLAARGAVLLVRARMGLVRTAGGAPDHVLLLLEDVARA